jgi:hypothetical protein
VRSACQFSNSAAVLTARSTLERELVDPGVQSRSGTDLGKGLGIFGVVHCEMSTDECACLFVAQGLARDVVTSTVLDLVDHELHARYEADASSSPDQTGRDVQDKLSKGAGRTPVCTSRPDSKTVRDRMWQLTEQCGDLSKIFLPPLRAVRSR